MLISCIDIFETYLNTGYQIYPVFLWNVFDEVYLMEDELLTAAKVEIEE